MAERPEDEPRESMVPTHLVEASNAPADRPRPAADPGVDLEPDDGSQATGATSVPGTPRTERYGMRDEIARGGMGAIFRVRDKELRRSIAMKVLLGGDPASRAPGAPVSADHLCRFLEEAQITAQLAHPGVVPVHEVGVDAKGRVFFTMNLVRGETLSRVIRKARAGKDGWTRARCRM